MRPSHVSWLAAAALIVSACSVPGCGCQERGSTPASSGKGDSPAAPSGPLTESPTFSPPPTAKLTPPPAEPPPAAEPPPKSAEPASEDEPRERPPRPEVKFGTLGGRVLHPGPAPQAVKLVIDPKTAAGCCAGPVDDTDTSLLVSSDGGLANVVVELGLSDGSFKGQGQRAVLDQKCCSFQPHVVIAAGGGTLEVKNSDSVNHNVHSFPIKNQAINTNSAAGGTAEMSLEKTEVFKVSCDIHTWMAAWVYVTDTRWIALTDADGRFTIPDVPPGEYTLKLWHEKLGKKNVEDVPVNGEQTKPVEIVFKK